MKNYIGVKQIKGQPMNLGDYNKSKGWTIPANEDPTREGYEVTYADGYVSWSPKEIFEEAYRETTGLTFGLAIEAVKLGKKVARSGWNGKGMWLSYCDPYFNSQFTLIEKDIEGTFAPYIGMKTVDNKYVPWLASQTDVLAEDWLILEK